MNKNPDTADLGGDFSDQAQGQSPEPPISSTKNKTTWLSRILPFKTAEDVYQDEISKAFWDGDYDKVNQLADEAIARDPQDVEAMVNKALAYVGKDNIKESMKWNKAALAIDPDNIAALNNLGCDYSDIGAHDKALETFMTAHQKNSTDTLVQLNIARTLEDLGRNDEALEWYQKVGVDPNQDMDAPATAESPAFDEAVPVGMD